MKIEIDTDDTFFAGGNYDRVHLVNADKTFDDLDGKDSFWFVKVKKGTATHDRINKCIKDRPSDYDMVLDVMLSSKRLAGARFTKDEAEKLCARIMERATKPSGQNVTEHTTPRNEA